MADASNSKRNSIAGKIATPKTAGGNSPAMQPLSDPLASLSKAIGAKVRLTTAAPHSQTYEGSLYTADPVLNIVAINTRSSTSTIGDYHIVPVSRIQNFQLLSLAGQTGDGSLPTVQPAIGHIDTKHLKQREEKRIRELKEKEQDRGKGVSKEGQAIFDALKRINVQVRWHNAEIVANDQVIICPPYGPEYCRGKQPDAVARIKRILEGERKKLKEKEERERKAATPAGPRKGG